MTTEDGNDFGDSRTYTLKTSYYLFYVNKFNYFSKIIRNKPHQTTNMQIHNYHNNVTVNLIFKFLVNLEKTWISATSFTSI